MTAVIRRATAADQDAVTRLVRGARLNGRSLEWPRFVVAEAGGDVVGVAQVRLYPDGARELASLVVLASHRGRGVAGAMVDELLADGAGPTYLLIDRPYLAHFGRWGFRPVAPATLPASVRRTYRVGRAVTTVLSIAARRRIRIVAAARP